LLARLFDAVDTLEEIERRELGRLKGIEWGPERWQPGRAIVPIIREAGLDEPAQRDLVRVLRKIMNRCRSYIAAVGDWRRERGLAVPLCWLPGPDEGGPES
jgi:hypothetical protein